MSLCQHLGYLNAAETLLLYEIVLINPNHEQESDVLETRFLSRLANNRRIRAPLILSLSTRASLSKGRHKWSRDRIRGCEAHSIRVGF